MRIDDKGRKRLVAIPMRENRMPRSRPCPAETSGCEHFVGTATEQKVGIPDDASAELGAGCAHARAGKELDLGRLDEGV